MKNGINFISSNIIQTELCNKTQIVFNVDSKANDIHNKFPSNIMNIYEYQKNNNHNHNLNLTNTNQNQFLGNKALRKLNNFFKQKSTENNLLEHTMHLDKKKINKNEIIKNKNLVNTDKNLSLPVCFGLDKQIPFEYIFEIWTEYKLQESDFPCLPKFQAIANIQSEINFETRAILIDWLIDVQEHFRLSDDTLFLCFSILDRSLSLDKTTKQKLQLLGVTAFSIASKIEEVYPPFLKNWVAITDNSFSSSEILNTENKLLSLLKFDFNYPTCFSFIQMISFQFKFSVIDFHYACYLLEVFSHHANFNKYLPSLISLAVSYLILKFKKFEKYKDLYLLINRCYSENDLKICAREIYEFSQGFSNLNFKAVIKKYSMAKYSYVAIKGLNLN